MPSETPNELVSVDTIIQFLKEHVEQKQPLPPSVWIDAAAKLNVLMSDESDKAFELEQKVAVIQTDLLRNDDKSNVSATKLRIKTTPEWLELKKLEAKIKMIEEFIRIAKLQARMRSEEMRGGS